MTNRQKIGGNRELCGDCPGLTWPIPSSLSAKEADDKRSIVDGGWWCGEWGFVSCYIIGGWQTVWQTYLSVVWTSGESHFLFTSTWTHPWSFSFAIQQPPFNSHMRDSSRVASTSGLAFKSKNVLCPHLAKPWHLSCGAEAGFFQKALNCNQKSKYSSSTVGLLLSRADLS